MKKYKAYLFDLDGTLINTFAMIIECFNHSLNYIAGISVSKTEIMQHIGLPLKDQFMVYLGDKAKGVDFDHLMQIHMDFQLKIWPDHVRLFDNAESTLAALKKQGALLAVVTSRRIHTTDLYTEKLGIKSYFDVLCTPESTTEHKPLPGPALWALDKLGVEGTNALFIGDSPFDIQCGDSAGTDTCYVKWGHTPPENLSTKPTYVIADLEDLLQQEEG